MMEDDGEENSDLDIDICAITPPASPEPDREPAITDGLPKMEELLSTLSKSRGIKTDISFQSENLIYHTSY